MPSRHFCKLTHKRSSEIDDVNLYVGFPHEFTNIPKAVPAVIVLTVRDQEQRFLRVLPCPHFSQSEINGVVERCRAFRRSERKAIAKLVDVGRKILSQFRPVRKLHQ